MYNAVFVKINKYAYIHNKYIFFKRVNVNLFYYYYHRIIVVLLAWEIHVILLNAIKVTWKKKVKICKKDTIFKFTIRTSYFYIPRALRSSSNGLSYYSYVIFPLGLFFSGFHSKTDLMTSYSLLPMICAGQKILWLFM